MNRTRSTLLRQLRELGQQEGWREFFDLYWMFIYRSALRKGLGESEAEEVTQETMVRVARAMPGFRYDRKRGSFKGWLSRIVGNVIIDHYRKAKARPDGMPAAEAWRGEPDAKAVEADLERIWDEEWTRNLMDLALKGTRNRVSLREYQIFHLHTIQGHSATETAELAGVSAGRVYVAKLRAGRVFRKEYARLKEEAN